MKCLAKILVLALLLLLGPACGPPAAQLKPKARVGLSAPEYHAPRGFWRANHPVLIQNPRAKEQGFFQVEECLFCHRPNDSCNRCHAYVGAAPLPDGNGGG